MAESSSKPTQNEYQQLINLSKSAVDIAQSVRDDADAGLFNGESGKDAVTDQTYNPQSENAQSGKAVAEAIESIKFRDMSSKIKNSTLYLVQTGALFKSEISDNVLILK